MFSSSHCSPMCLVLAGRACVCGASNILCNPRRVVELRRGTRENADIDPQISAQHIMITPKDEGILHVQLGPLTN